MKTNYLLSGLFIAASLLVVNTSRVNSESDQPPPVSVGDAFVGNTCARAGCHESFPVQDAPDSYITLNIGTGQPTTPLNTSFQYAPNTDYNIALSLSPQASVYGFGLSALNASATQAGSFTITNGVTTSSTVTGGRTYIGHKDANNIKNWAFKWTSPATAVGPVTFSYAFNLGDNDGSRFNDSIFKGNVTIAPLGVSINEIDSKIAALQVLPNPVNDVLNLSFILKQQDNITAQLYTLEGKVCKDLLNERIAQSSVNRTFNVSDLPSGVYLLQLQVGDAYTTQKIVKQ